MGLPPFPSIPLSTISMGLKDFVDDQTNSGTTTEEQQLSDDEPDSVESPDEDVQYTDADSDTNLVSPGYSDDPITKAENERRSKQARQPFADREHQGNKYPRRVRWEYAPDWKHCPRCGALCSRGVDEDTGEEKRHYKCTYPDCGSGQFCYSRVYDGGYNPWYPPEEQAPFLWGWERWFKEEDSG